MWVTSKTFKYRRDYYNMEPETVLRKIGFAEYEIKCYLSLVALKTGTVGQVSKDSGVPRNKAYDVLEKMKNKGLLMELPTKPKKFKILSLDRLRGIVEDEKTKIVSIEKDTDELISSLGKFSVEKFQDLVWVIRGQKNIIQKIGDEMNNVKKESLACTRSSIYYGPELRNTKKAIDRGVKVKIIVALDKNNLDKIKKWADIGVEFRVYDEKKFGSYGTRFSTFDDRACRLTIGKPEVKSAEDYISIWSESPSLVNLFRRQFYHMWGQCKPLNINKI